MPDIPPTPKPPELKLVLPQEPDWKRSSFWILVLVLLLNGSLAVDLFQRGTDWYKLVLLGIFVLNGLGYAVTRDRVRKL